MSGIIEPLLKEARDRIALLSQSLPTAVDPLAISTIAKTPYTALTYRETQAWRLEEFARAACDMFERGDQIVGASNARHAIECVAGVFYLWKLIEKAIADPTNVPHAHGQILRLIAGWKNAMDDDLPEAINVLTMIDKVDKQVEGFRRSYDRLSEIAHPNYAGSLGTFVKRDDSTLINHIGRGLRPVKHTQLGLNSLCGALDIFGLAYNRTSDIILDFAKVCERHIEERNKAVGLGGEHPGDDAE